MKKKLPSSGLMILSLTLVSMGCDSNDTVSSKNLILCPEVRPQICTQDYNPVCARQEDGSWKTYPNGCTACGNPKVVGYGKGECKGDMISGPVSPGR